MSEFPRLRSVRILSSFPRGHWRYHSNAERGQINYYDQQK